MTVFHLLRFPKNSSRTQFPLKQSCNKPFKSLLWELFPFKKALKGNQWESLIWFFEHQIRGQVVNCSVQWYIEPFGLLLAMNLIQHKLTMIPSGSWFTIGLCLNLVVLSRAFCKTYRIHRHRNTEPRLHSLETIILHRRWNLVNTLMNYFDFTDVEYLMFNIMYLYTARVANQSLNKQMTAAWRPRTLQNRHTEAFSHSICYHSWKAAGARKGIAHSL